MILKNDIIDYVVYGLSDDHSAVTMVEIEDTIPLAIQDYSSCVPLIAEVEFTTVSGTTQYTLSEEFLDVLSVSTSADTTVAYTLFNQQIRLTTSPSDDTFTATVYKTHETDVDGNYDTIPQRHLSAVGNFTLARVLDRIADDLIRRPLVRSGQTMEDFGNSPRTMARRATYLRKRTQDELSTTHAYVG